jgi:hypothetical protein
MWIIYVDCNNKSQPIIECKLPVDCICSKEASRGTDRTVSISEEHRNMKRHFAIRIVTDKNSSAIQL